MVLTIEIRESPVVAADVEVGLADDGVAVGKKRQVQFCGAVNVGEAVFREKGADVDAAAEAVNRLLAGDGVGGPTRRGKSSIGLGDRTGKGE